MKQTKDRKAEILQTAALLFKQKGYSAVTMRDLADAVGIKAASLYNHINSKQQILSEIIFAIAEDFTEGIEEIVAQETNAQAKLKAVVAQHITLTADNPYGMAALNNDWMHLEDRLEYYLKLRNQYEKRFREIVLNGQQSGQLKNVSHEILLFSVLSTLRNLYLWIPRKADLQKEKLIDDLSEILLQGVVQ
ncbi:TetR/AcrR family transcriptional regulator [Dokdonia sinensis]|uniref:TetR/AcrR family transcriptional regulator n=1 Tax=Dokdonia sinensis TaxID=2479847 RepID=A0A3M0GDU0_9FLAO|nr:TetR/AcrR family transcriptional regulator [Dokdonia sinensis]RMB62890.1 TetR/AcrR family transcriptional regulator [Dokdonia sinensis]